MSRFQQILFPVDFSDRCMQLAPYIAGVARTFNSRVVLLHAFDVYDPFGYGAYSSTHIYTDEIRALREQREKALAEFGKAALDGLTITRIIENGEPAATITQYVREHGIEVVMIPTHGYGGFRRFVLGSVTMKVLHDAPCPVWTTAHHEHLDEMCGRCISEMICGVSFGRDSACIVKKAHEIAQQYGVELRLVHAVGADEGNDPPFQRFLIDTAMDKLAALQEEAGTDLETRVKRGDVATVLRDCAVDWGAGLSIVGRGHADKALGSLRTHVHAIVRESPCPVLSL